MWIQFKISWITCLEIADCLNLRKNTQKRFQPHKRLEPALFNIVCTRHRYFFALLIDLLAPLEL